MSIKVKEQGGYLRIEKSIGRPRSHTIYSPPSLPTKLHFQDHHQHIKANCQSKTEQCKSQVELHARVLFSPPPKKKMIKRMRKSLGGRVNLFQNKKATVNWQLLDINNLKSPRPELSDRSTTRSPTSRPDSFFQPLTSSNDCIFSSRKRVVSTDEELTQSPKKMKYQNPQRRSSSSPQSATSHQQTSSSMPLCSEGSTKSITFGDITVWEEHSNVTKGSDSYHPRTNSITKSVDEFEAARLLNPRRRNAALLVDGETKKQVQLLILKEMMSREMEMKALQDKIEQVKEAERTLAIKRLKLVVSSSTL